MKHTRIMQICEYVYQHDTVSLEQLQKQFNVSMNTIRRDVAQLVAEGKIQKIYGGVCIKENTGRLVPFTQRSAKKPQRQRKHRLPRGPACQRFGHHFFRFGHHYAEHHQASARPQKRHHHYLQCLRHF